MSTNLFPPVAAITNVPLPNVAPSGSAWVAGISGTHALPPVHLPDSADFPKPPITNREQGGRNYNPPRESLPS